MGLPLLFGGDWRLPGDEIATTSRLTRIDVSIREYCGGEKRDKFVGGLLENGASGARFWELLLGMITSHDSVAV